MAYETASATSPGDLIDKLRVFALANGWAVDYDGPHTGGSIGAGSKAVLLRKGSVYAGFFTDTANGTASDPGPYVGVAHYPGPYSSGAAPQAQAGMSSIVWSNKLAGPYQAYHFFASGSYLHVVVEVTPGSFRHLGCGQLEKAGAITTGAYAHGLRWSFDSNYVNQLVSYHMLPFDDAGANAQTRGTSIRADSDALSPRNAVIMDIAGQGGSGWGGFMRTGNYDHEDAPLSGLMRVGPSTLTGRAVMFPCMVGVHRPAGMVSLLGSPPDVRWLRIDNLAPGALITVGPDNWRVFPVIRKNGPAGQENSGNYGMAYRVVA